MVDDADRVARFLSERGAELTADDLRRWWTAPTTELAEDTRIAEAGGGELVGYGIVHPQDREYARIALDAWVDPVGGGRPAASGLLAALVLRADKLAGRAPAGTPVVLRGRIEVPEEGGESLLEEHGLAATGGAFRVTIAFIDPPPEPAWPEGLVLEAVPAGCRRAGGLRRFRRVVRRQPGLRDGAVRGMVRDHPRSRLRSESLPGCARRRGGRGVLPVEAAAG